MGAYTERLGAHYNNTLFCPGGFCFQNESPGKSIRCTTMYGKIKIENLLHFEDKFDGVSSAKSRKIQF